MKLIAFVFALALSAQAQDHHFFDVEKDSGSWRVHHFKATPGELQDLVSTRTFPSEALAHQYKNRLSQRFPQQKSVSFVSRESGARPLWKVTNSWTVEWEKKYAEWIAREFDAEYFVRTNFATDCADVAYTLRWVFARNNGLPAAGTLAGSGVVASHLSAKKEWDNLPGDPLWHKDQRFVAALKWLMNNVYTKTLYVDGYPVKLTRESVTPGLINLLGGHTEIFSRISYRKGDIPLELLSSTVPQAVRTLAGRVFLDPRVTDKESGGLIKFRWPVIQGDLVVLTAKDAMWDYSLEQYDEKLCPEESRFGFCLIQRLGMDFDPGLIAERMISDLVSVINQRIEIVRDGIAFCAQNDCSPGTMGYEDWSTPSRDKRLKESVKNTKNILGSIERLYQFEAWAKKTMINVPGPLSISDFIARHDLDLTSYDPRDDEEQRWAYDEAAIERGVWSFHRRTEASRKELVKKAESCRKDPGLCQKDPKNFSELSTVDLDQSLVTKFAGWIRYAKILGMKPGPGIVQTYLNFFGRSPAPWDSLEERNRELRGSPHLIQASSRELLTPRYLLLDGVRLYDLELRREVILGETAPYSVTFDRHTRSFLVLFHQEFRILDEALGLRGTFSYAGHAGAALSLGDGAYLIREQTSSLTMSGHVFDLRTLKKGKSYKFDSFHASGSWVLLETSDSHISLTSSGGWLSEVALPKTGISSFFPLGNHRYFIQRYSDNYETSEYGILSPEGLEIQGKNSWSYITTIGPDWGQLMSGETFRPISRASGKLLDIKGFIAAELPGGIALLNEPQALEVFSLDGFGISRFPLPKGTGIEAQGAGWLSTTRGGVINYDGIRLAPDSVFAIHPCKDNCASSDDQILKLTYRRDGLTYSAIGPHEDFKLRQVLAYIPQEDSPIDMEGEVVVGDAHFQNQSGTLVSVGEGMHLYFSSGSF